MALTFGQVVDVLAAANGLHPEKRDTFIARLKQWQKAGFPAGVNVGKGARAKYGATQVFQLALLMRMLAMGLPPERAQEIILIGWDRFKTAIVGVTATKASGEDGTLYLLIQYDALTDLKEPKADHAHVFIRPTPHWMVADALNSLHDEEEPDPDETEEQSNLRKLVYSLLWDNLVNVIILEIDSIVMRVWLAMTKLGIEPEKLGGEVSQWSKADAIDDDSSVETSIQRHDNLADVAMNVRDFASRILLGSEE